MKSGTNLSNGYWSVQPSSILALESSSLAGQLSTMATNSGSGLNLKSASGMCRLTSSTISMAADPKSRVYNIAGISPTAIEIVEEVKRHIALTASL